MSETITEITLLQSYVVEVRELIEEESDGKREKSILRSFLVEAVSPTDIDVKIAQYYNGMSVSYKIASIKFSKIKDIIR